MNKYLAAICGIIWLICFVPFFGGCDKQSELPENDKVVSKKIVAPKSGVTQPEKPKVISKKIVAPKSGVAQTEKPKVISKKIVAPKSGVAQTEKPKVVAKQVSDKKEIVVTKDVSQPMLKPEKRISVQPKSIQRELKPEVDSLKSIHKGLDEKFVASILPSTQKKKIPGKGYFYNPAGKIDPFAPLLTDKPKITISKKKKRTKRIPRTPLEKVDLSQLRLTGIIRASSGDKVLVKEASGKGYIVTKGTYIGIHSGRVIEIQKDRIIVEEEIENVYGEVKLTKRELKLQKPPGEY